MSLAEHSPTRVLIAHYHAHIVSGAERSIADLVDRLDPRFQVVMLTPGEGRLADFYRERGFTVLAQAVSGPRRMYPGLHSIQSWGLSRWLRSAGISVVIANTFAAASRVMTASRLAGVPLGIYVREIITDRPIHREILDRADRVMVISRDLQAYIGTMTDPARVRLTYNYIQPDPIVERVERHRRAGRRRLPFEPRFPVVGLIGRITPWKQQDLFVRAAALVLQKVPDARFVVVGSAEQSNLGYETQVRALAKSLGLGERLVFMGERDDAVEITAELAVSCLTSTREPLGRVILEAHLANTPVLGPNVGGPAEIIIPEKTGLTFTPTGPGALAEFSEQLVRLLLHPALRHTLAENARQHVLETFAGQAHITVQENVFDELADLRTEETAHA